jgi:hypothetical protein
VKIKLENMKANIMRQILLSLLSLGLLGLACSSSSGTPMVSRLDLKPLPQPIVFQQSFVNNAWGYQNRGWFIDGGGVVKAFQVREAALWHPVEKTGPDSGFIATDALLANSNVETRVVYVIPLLELHKYYKLLQKAADGTISERARGAYDAGLVQYSGFVWDDTKGMYKSVLIGISGDWIQTNTHPAAGEIRAYLDAINTFYADSLQVWQL